MHNYDLLFVYSKREDHTDGIHIFIPVLLYTSTRPMLHDVITTTNVSCRDDERPPPPPPQPLTSRNTDQE